VRIGAAGVARRHQRVDLIEEDDARRRLLGLAKHVAHAPLRLAHVLGEQRRTFYGNEIDPALSGDGLGQQRLAAAGRAGQQNSLGRAYAGAQ
jgi:hypothetical protein